MIIGVINCYDQYSRTLLSSSRGSTRRRRRNEMGGGGSKSSAAVGDGDFFDDLEMINSTLGPPLDYPAFVDGGGGGNEDVMVLGGSGLNDTTEYSGNYTLSVVAPQGYSTLHIVIASIILTCMMIVVVIGNMLVIIAIATEKSLKNLQNWFIASLAVADFFVGLLIMPFSLANELMGYWIFGKVWCSIHSALDVLLCTSSIMNICLISLDRYWSITQAIEYLKKRTPARAAIMIAMVWVLSALISIPPLMGWRDDSPQDENYPTCELSQKIGYVLYSAMGSFYIPSCIMVFVYIRIYFAARDRARRQIRKSPRPKPQSSSVVIDPEESRHGGGHGSSHTELPLSPLKTSESSSSPKMPLSPTLQVPNDSNMFNSSSGNSNVAVAEQPIRHVVESQTSPIEAVAPAAAATATDEGPSEPTTPGPNPEITVENCSPEVSVEDSLGGRSDEGAKKGSNEPNSSASSCNAVVGSPGNDDEFSLSPTTPPAVSDLKVSSGEDEEDESETGLPEVNNQLSNNKGEVEEEELRPSLASRGGGEPEGNHEPFNASVITVRDMSKHPNIEKLRTDLGSSGAPASISVMVTTASVASTNVPHHHHHHHHQPPPPLTLTTCMSATPSSGGPAVPKSSKKRPKLHFLKVDSPTIWRTSSSLSLNGDVHILGTMSRSGSRTQLEADPVSDMEPSSSDSGAVSRCAVVKPLKLRLCQPFFGKKHHASATSSNKARRDVVDTGKLNSPKEIRDPEREKRRIARKKEKRATLILGLIMGSFILCWLPFFFLYIFSPLCECDIAPWGFAVAFWLGYMNSALNPVIYTIFNKDFRRAFRRILFK